MPSRQSDISCVQREQHADWRRERAVEEPDKNSSKSVPYNHYIKALWNLLLRIDAELMMLIVARDALQALGAANGKD
jgi:hypothetical protein